MIDNKKPISTETAKVLNSWHRDCAKDKLHLLKRKKKMFISIDILYSIYAAWKMFYMVFIVSDPINSFIFSTLNAICFILKYKVYNIYNTWIDYYSKKIDYYSKRLKNTDIYIDDNNMFDDNIMLSIIIDKENMIYILMFFVFLYFNF